MQKTYHRCTTGLSFGDSTLYILYCGHLKSYQGSRFVIPQLCRRQSTILVMCSFGQRYLNVKNYFLHRRCRSVDGVELIKTKPVEVRILVVQHGSSFISCRAQRIAPVRRRCYTSLIHLHLSAYFNESMERSTLVDQLVSSSFY